MLGGWNEEDGWLQNAGGAVGRCLEIVKLVLSLLLRKNCEKDLIFLAHLNVDAD